MEYPSLCYLKHVLKYDPETGLFVWLVKRNSYGGKAKPGAVAGTLKTGKGGGYILVNLDQKHFRAHCLAWYYMTGEIVEKPFEVDHRDRDRANNIWINLRKATRSQNNTNSNLRSDSISGVKGVSKLNCLKNPWMARIKVNGKIIHLGCYPTVEEAAKVRKEAEAKYHNEIWNCN